MATLVASGGEVGDRSTIINFFTDGSLTAKDDETALTNNRFPQYGLSLGIRPDPFKTFCFVAAACAMDDRFDHLCFGVLGKDETEELWTKLGRPRTGPSDRKPIPQWIDELAEDIRREFGY
jgi:hypothetical protein